MLSECIRRYFFPSRAKETKKQKIIIIIIITPDLRLKSLLIDASRQSIIAAKEMTLVHT